MSYSSFNAFWNFLLSSACHIQFTQLQSLFRLLCSSCILAPLSIFLPPFVDQTFLHPSLSTLAHTPPSSKSTQNPSALYPPLHHRSSQPMCICGHLNPCVFVVISLLERAVSHHQLPLLAFTISTSVMAVVQLLHILINLPLLDSYTWPPTIFFDDIIYSRLHKRAGQFLVVMHLVEWFCFSIKGVGFVIKVVFCLSLQADMKLLLLCLAATSAFAWPSFVNDAAPSLALRQQAVNHLVYRVNEPLHYDDLKAAAANFNPVADKSIYSDGGVAAQHLVDELTDHRLLEKHHWFSLFNPRQREEALLLFDVLMHCKTWEAALNNAAYFREQMNEGEFVYALYAAVIHSELGAGIVLPPLYEVTPHMFTNSEIIQKAYTAKMTQTPGSFKMDFSGSQRNPEKHVAYFGEDIGLNVHHVTWHLDFPFWWEDSYGYHLDRKGELFFWAHHQLTVRFDAERLSNHLDMVDELYWDRPIKNGFAPHTTYKYGGEFPSRPDNIEFEDVDGLVNVRDMIIHESRIRDAIAHGYITSADGSHINIRDEHGIDHLGDIIESSLYSPNAQYYGALHNEAHIILGHQADPHGKFNLPPSVMEHFETATRDPAFFRLHKYMDNIFKEHKDSLTPYTAEEIGFPGVHLTSFGIEGELETHFEDFEYDLKMAVDSSDSVKEVEIKAHVSRLNHKDFAFTFDIKSNAADQHAVVRVFLCPRKDNNGVIFTFEEGRWNCIEMDKFWTKLNSGDNHIKRKGTESSVTVPDIPSFASLIHDADEAVASGSDLHLEEFDRSCGIPSRLLLPKGTSEGMEFALVVAVSDGSTDAKHDALEAAEAHGHPQCGVHGEKYPDHQPMGFPLDRRIPDERVFLKADNVGYTIVKVFHKE